MSDDPSEKRDGAGVNMTTQEKVIAVAKWVGWTNVHTAIGLIIGIPPGRKGHKQIPNYSESLDAVSEVEMLLNEAQWEEYHRQLWVATDIVKSPNASRALICCTASQRLEALCESLNLKHKI